MDAPPPTRQLPSLAGADWLARRQTRAVFDALAAETYRANFRDVRLWELDVRDLSVARVRRELNLRLGELDLLAGCPPCPDGSALSM